MNLIVLKVSDSVTKALGVMTRFLPSDTFKTRSQKDSVKTQWHTGEEEVKKIQYYPLYEKCSSSSVCHLVVRESCCDYVLKVSEDETCSSSSVFHLIMTHNTFVKESVTTT